MRAPEVHGHRGARAARPENTMAAFEYAVAAGADWIELDVNVTRDDVLVVTHDPLFNPVVCSGGQAGATPVIRELALEEVRGWDCGTLRHPNFPRQQSVPGARIPTLDEVLALGARVNVEVKSYPRFPQYAPPPAQYAGMVVDALRRHGAERRAMVQSFDFRILQEVRALEPELPRAALWERGREDFVSVAREAGAMTVSAQHTLVTPEKVQAAQRKGIGVLAWTVNGRSNWERLLRAGVDGIITDDPAGLIAFLREKGLRA
jgi:glycerophosphoryl diester phosphodiesterase